MIRRRHGNEKLSLVVVDLTQKGRTLRIGLLNEWCPGEGESVFRGTSRQAGERRGLCSRRESSLATNPIERTDTRPNLEDQPLSEVPGEDLNLHVQMDTST